MRIDELVDYVEAGLTANVATRRAEAADSVTDGLGAYSDQDADRLARCLVSAAVAESDGEALEAELHALDALVSRYPIERGVVGPVLNRDSSELGESEQEYLTELRAYYEGRDG